MVKAIKMAQNLLAPAALLRTGEAHDRHFGHQKTKLGKDSINFLNILGGALVSGDRQSANRSASKSNDGSAESLIPDLLGIILKKSTPDNAAVLATAQATGNPTLVLPTALELGGELSGRLIEASADLTGRLAVSKALQAVKDGNRESLLTAKNIGQEAGTGRIKLSGLYSEENLQSARELVSRLQKLPEAAKAIRKEGAQADGDPSARLTLDPSKIRTGSADASAKGSEFRSFIFDTASSMELKAFERLNAVRNQNTVSAAAHIESGRLAQAAALLHSEGFSLLRGKSFNLNSSENTIVSENSSQPHKAESHENTAQVHKSEKYSQSGDTLRHGVSEQNMRSVEGDTKAHPQLEEAALKGEFTRMAKSAEALGLKDMAGVLRNEARSMSGTGSGMTDGMPTLNVKLDSVQNNIGLGERLSDSRVSAALMERMVESAEWIRQNAKPTVRLQLAPQFLGGMEISLEAGEDSARLHIVAERGQVARALESSAGQLALKLSEAGLPVKEIVVEHESFNFAGQNPDHNSNSHRHFNETEEGGRTVFKADRRVAQGIELTGLKSGKVSYHDGDIDLMA